MSDWQDGLGANPVQRSEVRMRTSGVKARSEVRGQQLEVTDLGRVDDLSGDAARQVVQCSHQQLRVGVGHVRERLVAGGVQSTRPSLPPADGGRQDSRLTRTDTQTPAHRQTCGLFCKNDGLRVEDANDKNIIAVKFPCVGHLLQHIQ